MTTSTPNANLKTAAIYNAIMVGVGIVVFGFVILSLDGIAGAERALEVSCAGDGGPLRTFLAETLEGIESPFEHSVIVEDLDRREKVLHR